MNRAVRIGIAALLASLAGTGAASSGAEKTIVHTFVAFKAGRVAPGVTVIATVSGSCHSGSGVMTRKYAWRCYGGRFIYDPCFSDGLRSDIVVCPAYPWSKRIRVMRLTEPLPRWQKWGRATPTPWGIWTTTGKRCFLLSHWQGEVAGRRQTYNCVGGGVLAGFVHRRSALWKIYYAPSWRCERVILVGISDAWQ